MASLSTWAILSYWRSTIEQHDESLEKAMNKLVQIGLPLNSENPTSGSQSFRTWEKW